MGSDLWIQAANSLTDEEKEILNFANLRERSVTDAVLATVQRQKDECVKKQWSFVFKGKQVVVRDVLQNIVKWTRKFQKAVDFVVSMDASGHAALPWACIKFCLEIAGNDLEKYAAMLVGMEFVTREMHFYTIFEAVYTKKRSEATDQLRGHLLKTYGNMLRYLAKAKKFFSKRVHFNPFDENGVSSMMADVEKARAVIEQSARLVDKQDLESGLESLNQGQKELKDELTSWKEPLESLSIAVAEINDTTKRTLAVAEETQATSKQILSVVTASAKADELPTIHRHLDPPSVTDYETLVRKIIPGTATWILQQPAFLGWVNYEKPVLFLSGGPGCGKSYLSTLTISHLLQSSKQHGPQEVSVGYYYFHDNDQRRQSMLSALCAIVYQIADQNEVYRMHAALACQSSPAISMATISSVWKDFITSEYGPKSSGRLFLVFDGIDEAATDDIREFIALLRESLQDDLRIQILFVGRPEMESFVQKLGQPSCLATIEISGEINAADISRFIEVKYDEYISIKKVKGLREQVIGTMRQKANGMFLWVDLMYQELEEIKQPKKMKLTLENMSTGLTALYERIFTRIETTKGGGKAIAQLREIFCLVAYSKEPVAIFMMNQIIQFVTADDVFDAERAMRTACASLFQLVPTGRALFDSLLKSETVAKSDLGKGGRDDTPGEKDEWDEDSESESEMDEDEAEEREENRQADIFVQLRHASLGDYVKRQDIKTSGVLFNASEARIHILLTSLQIVCEGSGVGHSVWLYAMKNWLDQLRELDEKTVSEQDTKLVVERIAAIFTSEPLGKYIAQHHSERTGYPLHNGDCFFFGANTDLQHRNRLAIHKWFKRAADMKSAGLAPDTAEWVNDILAHPLKLLVPLSKTCIQEWLSCDDEPNFQLNWRFQFAWRCVISTDLIPPYPNPRERVFGYDDCPQFVNGNPHAFLASLVEVEWSIETHARMARSMAYGRFKKGSVAEYQKAVELAEDLDSKEKLSAIYLEYALSLTDVRLMTCDTNVLKPVEAYIAIDPSNYKMQTCLGVARYQLDDRKGAIEAFRKALSIEPRDNLVCQALVGSLWEDGAYAEVMALFESHDLSTAGFWLRGQLHQDGFPGMVFHAARKVGKLDALIAVYEHEIASKCPQGSDEDAGDDENNTAKRDMLWDRLGLAAELCNDRRYFSAGTALLRCWLAVLYRCYMGQPDAALALFNTAIFQRSELFKLTQMSTSFSHFTIPQMFMHFAETLHDKASSPPDGGTSVDVKMMYMLERLRQRHDAFRKLDLHVAELNDTKAINMLLARLFLRCGRVAEAQALLSEQFARAIEILKDHVEWNDSDGFLTIAKILYMVGEAADAEIAASLMRFRSFKPPGEDPDEKNDDDDDDDDDDDGTNPLRCHSSWNCPSGSDFIAPDSPVYACMTCTSVIFCEQCHAALVSPASVPKPTYVCSADHEFVCAPLPNWAIAEGVMRFGEGAEEIREVKVADWLDKIEKDWKRKMDVGL